HVVVGQTQQFLSDPIAVAQAKVAHAADLVGGLAALDPALRDGRMPVRQAVEVPHARPDAVVARVDDSGYVNPGHGASALLLWSALGGRLATSALRCRRLGVALLARGRVLDALHVARLANEAGHLGEAAALDTNVRENGINQRRLHAIAQGGIDHLVRGAAPAIADAVAVEAVDLKDADALDLLHRLDALAHDAFDAVEQLAAEQRIACLICQHVLGLVQHPLRFGLN